MMDPVALSAPLRGDQDEENFSRQRHQQGNQLTPEALRVQSDGEERLSH